MRKLTVFLLFAGVLCIPFAEAMPTEAEIQEVRPILQQLTEDDYAALKAGKKTRSELADSLLGYVSDAESEAAKFSLIQMAFKNYMEVYEPEKAIMAFDSLDSNVKDVPRGTFGDWCSPHVAKFAKNGRADALAVLLNKSLDSGDAKSTSALMTALKPYMRKLGAGAKAPATPFAAAVDRATRQERRARELATLKATVKKSPSDASAHEKYALALAATGDWAAALKEFALASGSVAEAAAWETKWPNAGESSWTPAKAAELWWDRADTAKDEDAATVLRGRSVAWYKIAIDKGELTGLRKTIAEKRIREAEEPAINSAASSVVQANGGSQSPSASDTNVPLVKLCKSLGFDFPAKRPAGHRDLDLLPLKCRMPGLSCVRLQYADEGLAKVEFHNFKYYQKAKTFLYEYDDSNAITWGDVVELRNLVASRMRIEFPDWGRYVSKITRTRVVAKDLADGVSVEIKYTFNKSDEMNKRLRLVLKDPVKAAKMEVEMKQREIADSSRLGNAMTIIRRRDPNPNAWAWTTKAPPAGWELPGFNDSAWGRSAGGFGNINSHMQAVTAWDTSEIWLRRHFHYSAPAKKNAKAILELLNDDDVVVYLNGQPLWGWASVSPNWTSYEIPWERFNAAVKSGDNVIAVKCIDRGWDRYIDLGLLIDVAK